MRRLPSALAACALVAFWAGAGLGQEGNAAGAGAAQSVPLLTLDENQLFAESAFGKAALARQDADARALIEENRRIEAALEVEEQDLTTRRPTMGREEFTPLSDAFNLKVEGIRKAQDAKSRDLNRRADQDRQAFLLAVRPVLADLMAARGAVAIIDKRAVFVGFENIDITAEAIAELDKALAEGRLTAPGNPDEAAKPASP